MQNKYRQGDRIWGKNDIWKLSKQENSDVLLHVRWAVYLSKYTWNLMGEWKVKWCTVWALANISVNAFFKGRAWTKGTLCCCFFFPLKLSSVFCKPMKEIISLLWWLTFCNRQFTVSVSMSKMTCKGCNQCWHSERCCENLKSRSLILCMNLKTAWFG